MASAVNTAVPRVARVLANVLLAFLVVYAGVTLARITWLVAWQERPVVPLQQAFMNGQEASRVPRQSIAAYELFGRPAGDTQVVEAVRRSAPETRLRLRLEGVLVAERAEDSGAIVAGSDGVTEHYRLGETLPGNAELVEVEPGRILIRRNDMYETLTFDDSVSEGIVVDEPEDEPQVAVSPDQFLANAREQLDTEGVQALVAFGLRPVEDGGSPGYVYDGSNAMLNAVNLQAGDVITAINGQPLGDLEQDRQLLDSWRNESQLEIEIERDGSRLTVSYAIPEQWR